MNIPSYLPGPPSRILTGSAGAAKLSKSLDKLQAAYDATDAAAITEAVTKAIRPILEKAAQTEKDGGNVTVNTSSLPGVPGPTPPTDKSQYKLPTDDGRKPDPQGDVARQYQPPKSEEPTNE